MTIDANKAHEKIDEIAATAKKEVSRIVDKTNEAAHVVVEKTREQTERAGEAMIAAGEKIADLAK
jgi:F0F1-type ATP synthase membrane subunit b/b'